MKFKDKSISVRINSQIHSTLKRHGVSVQTIVDEYIAKFFTTVLKIKEIKK